MVLILSTEFFTKFGLGWSGTSHEKFTLNGNFFVLVAVKVATRKREEREEKEGKGGGRK
jgi:hypothetical protein